MGMAQDLCVAAYVLPMVAASTEVVGAILGGNILEAPVTSK